jgi:hypothetical protein
MEMKTNRSSDWSWAPSLGDCAEETDHEPGCGEHLGRRVGVDSLLRALRWWNDDELNGDQDSIESEVSDVLIPEVQRSGVRRN